MTNTLLIKELPLKQSAYFRTVKYTFQRLSTLDTGLEQVISRKLWKLFLLSGSCVQGQRRSSSDVDFFLVIPLNIQKKFRLKPSYEWTTREGLHIDVSLVSVEKLLRDQFNKNELHWWWNTQVIKSTDNKLVKIWRNSSRFSEDQVKDLIWSDFFRFRHNAMDMRTLENRGDSLGVDLLYRRNLELLTHAFLASKHSFYSTKSSSRAVKAISPKLHKIVKSSQTIIFSRRQISRIEFLTPLFSKILLKKGFSLFEVKHWSESNLGRLLLQRI